MKKVIKFVVVAMLLLIVAMMSALAIRALIDRQVDYEVDLGDVDIPRFTAVEIDHVHRHNDKRSLPFTAGAAVDIDGDGVDEIFIGGGVDQDDAVFKFQAGRFIRVADAAGIRKTDGAPTLSALALDVDKDGKPDLIITRSTGIWLYTNSGGKFTGKKLDAPMNDDTTPLSVAVADINGDGHFDMYVSGYLRNDLVEGLNIFNKPGYGGTSALLMNRGDNSFTNETEKRGLLYKHNAFQSAFIDIDNDGHPDLIVAHDTGQVRTWRNDGTGKFTNVANPNSDEYSYPMGLAIGDYDNDGLTDFFFSNVGSSPPHFMVKGDLRADQKHNWKWMMFRNKGGMQFENTAENVKLADYEFGWGAVFEDLNLDGREDLLVSENFVKAPFHKLPFLRLPGRLFVQTAARQFAEVGAAAGVVNRHYSIAPITSDFNGDGAPDIVHINIAGPSQAFLSTGKPGNGYLKISLPNTVESIGAKVKITLDDGTVLHKPYVSGEGLASDSSHVITAGLGKHRTTRIEVKFLRAGNAERTGSFRNESIVVEAPR